MKDKLLIVVSGPTASGKTEYAMQLAQQYHCPIISADSRQVYNELSIGTAKPSDDELKKVKHYFINHISITEPYDVGQYLDEASSLIEELFRVYNELIVCGGTGLYIHAIMNGLDRFPYINSETRELVRSLYQCQGLQSIQNLLKEKDIDYYKTVDLNNPRRIMRALEVCLDAHQPYSSFLNQKKSNQTYTIQKKLLLPEREILYQKINFRVEKMLESGLIEEVKSLKEFRDHQALNTVGYKEVFDYLDEKISYLEMVDKIKQHTRNYAKRQITWCKKYFADDAIF